MRGAEVLAKMGRIRDEMGAEFDVDDVDHLWPLREKLEGEIRRRNSRMKAREQAERASKPLTYQPFRDFAVLEYDENGKVCDVG